MPTLQKLQKEIEIDIIKFHLNSHFLFNFLNNLYALALEKSDIIPETILTFSDILKYINSSARKNSVKINEEILCIEKLISIFSLKFSTKVNILTDFDSRTFSLEIEPMILIPLVYNSLYFSNVSENYGFINYKLIKKDNFIYFDVEFTHDIIFKSKNFDYNADDILKNLQNRLSLKFGENSSINVERNPLKTEYHLSIKC